MLSILCIDLIRLLTLCHGERFYLTSPLPTEDVKGVGMIAVFQKSELPKVCPDVLRDLGRKV